MSSLYKVTSNAASALSDDTIDQGVSPPSLSFIQEEKGFSHYVSLPNSVQVYGVRGQETSEPLDSSWKSIPTKSRSVTRPKRVTILPKIDEKIPVDYSLLEAFDEWSLGERIHPIKQDVATLRTYHRLYDAPKKKKKKRRISLQKSKKPLIVHTPHSGEMPIFGFTPAFPSFQRTWKFIPMSLHYATLHNKHQNYRLAHPICFEPQSGSEASNLLSQFAALASLKNIAVPDFLLSKVEDLILLYLIVRDCTTDAQLIAAVIQYCKTHISSSLLGSVSEYVSQLFAPMMQPHSGDAVPTWLSVVRNLKQNWTTVVKCEAFKKISYLTSLCITLGLCEAANCKFTIGKFEVFGFEALKKHVSSVDLLDAVFSTVAYFCEGGYRVFQTGSLSPLVYSDFEMELFEQDFMRCESCAEYHKTGDLERHASMNESDYDHLLFTTLEKANYLLSSVHGIPEKQIVRMRIDRLNRMRTALTQTRLSGGLRVAPFVLSFFGSSAQGKSSIAKIFMTALLKANEFSSSEEHICTVNENDKFMSNYRSHVTGVHLDDVGNAKSDFVERPPSQILIDLNNNVPTYASQAEADKKGKVVIEPKVVICTTNVKDLGASVYSNEPVSIARRAHYHVTVTAKPCFCTNGKLDAKKVFQYHKRIGDPNPIVPDLWNLKVEEAIPVSNKVQGGRDQVGWAVQCLRPEMTNKEDQHQLNKVGIADVLRFCIDKSKEHFEFQKMLVEGAKGQSDKLVLCKECSMPESFCECPCKDDASSDGSCEDSESESDSVQKTMEPHSGTLGAVFAGVLWHKVAQYKFRFSSLFDNLSERFETYSTRQLYRLARVFENSWMWQWTNYIPKKYLDYPIVESYIKYMERDQVVRNVTAHSLKLGALWVGVLGTSVYSPKIPISTWCVLGAYVAKEALSIASMTPIKFSWPTTTCLFWLAIGAPIGNRDLVPWSFAIPQTCYHIAAGLYTLHLGAQIIGSEEALYAELRRRNDAVPVMVKDLRDNQMETFLRACAALAALYAICKVWQQFRAIVPEQGNLVPTSIEEIESRDKEKNVWAPVEAIPLPCSHKSRSVTHERLCDIIAGNLTHMTCVVGDKKHHCDAVFVKSNVALVPNHMWKQPVMETHFIRHDQTKVGGNFKAIVAQSQSVHIRNTDFCVVWVPNGGDWLDITQYLPVGEIPQVLATMLYRDQSGSLIRGNAVMTPGLQTTHACENFKGAVYQLPFPTFSGLCMAPLISHTKGPMIAGFHLGGMTGQPVGCCGTVTLAEVDCAISVLSGIEGVLLSKSAGTVKTQMFDVQWFENTAIHEKSPTRFLPIGATCKVYGSCKGRAKYYSEVVNLPISASVEKHLGIPNRWGKPQFGKNYPWQASLKYAALPSIGVNPDTLRWSSRDYKRPLLSLLKQEQWRTLRESTKPLTMMQTVCGIDGRRFVDKMPVSTSIGYPLSGPKSKYITQLSSEDFPEFSSPCELDARFWDAWMECERLYLSGERAYFLWKACLKDEPTPLDKEKVRVFQAAPIVAQLGIRKYYLPLARILSLFPTLSECAVGVNAQSPEWDQLMKHVTKYGEDRILAGDYSKYDLRMPAQLLFAAFSILIDLARECGYTEYDITIMEGIATDVCYPLTVYNGDLIQLFGSNPSGQNLTVYINCIVNSLLFRCGARSILGYRCADFRSVCALITYGDDADSSVAQGFDEFNHISYAQYLAAHDMAFTMPDKKALPVPFMTHKDSHFLKRESKLLEGTDVHCGALEHDSIFKSLHTVLKSSAISTMEQAICNINGAAREFFFHGRQEYDIRREQLMQVAIEHGLQPACHDLVVSYQDRLDQWCEKYCVHNRSREDL